MHLGKLGKPEEIEKLAVCSKFVYGAVFVIDSGWLIK